MVQPGTKSSADLVADVAKSEASQGRQIVMRTVVANENRPRTEAAVKTPSYDAPEARNIAWEDDEYFYVFED